MAGLALCLGAGCVGGPRPSPPPPEPALELLALLELPPETSLDGLRVGGLSALARQGESDTYLALSDDRGDHGPPRYYRVRLAFDHQPAAQVISWRPLLDERGEPLASGAADPEGLALPGDGSLLVASEGLTDQGVAPFLRRYSGDGRLLSEIRLPPRFLPAEAGDRGVRPNLGFESLTLEPTEGKIHLAAESALFQDGPVADVGVPSSARLLTLAWPSGEVLSEHLYPLEPIRLSPRPTDAFRVGGLVELLAVAPGRLLALERQFAVGDGHAVRLYAVGLAAGDPARRWRSVGVGSDPWPVCKELLLDFEQLGFEPRNLEGLSWGPRLDDGRRTIVVVEDDNFDDGAAARILLLAPRKLGDGSWLPLARRCW